MLKCSFYIDSSSCPFKIHAVDISVSFPQSWPVYNPEAINQTFLILRFILQNNKIHIHDNLSHSYGYQECWDLAWSWEKNPEISVKIWLVQYFWSEAQTIKNLVWTQLNSGQRNGTEMRAAQGNVSLREDKSQSFGCCRYYKRKGGYSNKKWELMGQAGL